MDKDELQQVIKGCQLGNRLHQKQLYKHFYRYGMNVCHRYARTDEEAEEMLNDAFLRIFAKLDMYDPNLSFPAWFHTICVRSSINYIKKYQNQPVTTDIELAQNHGVFDTIVSNISANEILNLVRQLPPTYRAAFNLSVVEGYSHGDIATMMSITEGTARSNLMIARQKLQKMVSQLNTTKA
jgi:RNA polymerase sigma-70 factor, ECF subfamily